MSQDYLQSRYFAILILILFKNYFCLLDSPGVYEIKLDNLQNHTYYFQRKEVSLH